MFWLEDSMMNKTSAATLSQDAQPNHAEKLLVNNTLLVKMKELSISLVNLVYKYSMFSILHI